ncbi:MAG TPA: Crp/Fnr family transcriptional regulator [Acidimicrobiia bacterium]|nr:Crp/Fnr family transcriptional regulator [Acidimicrobiia bacterium]
MEAEQRSPAGRGNQILDALPPEVSGSLLAHTTRVSLELKHLLLGRGEPIDTIYFPQSAVISLLTTMDDGSRIEIATVGNEGIVGLPVFLGTQSMGARDFYQVQVPGWAVAVDSRTFLEATGTDPLRGLVQRYTQAFFSQVTQQVACNGLHSVVERCSRWMLLTHDRVGSDKFPLTQEFLAEMLGVRRPSVTVAAGMLQNAGFIHYSRGQVSIINRDGLENSACECYRIIRAEFDRLLP